MKCDTCNHRFHNGICERCGTSLEEVERKVVSFFEISDEPFIGEQHGDKSWYPDTTYQIKSVPMVHVELHLHRIIDDYDYHDYPSHPDIWWTKEEVEKLIEILSDRLEKMKELRNV